MPVFTNVRTFDNMGMFNEVETCLVIFIPAEEAEQQQS